MSYDRNSGGDSYVFEVTQFNGYSGDAVLQTTEPKIAMMTELN
jgi:hypothetical protein